MAVEWRSGCLRIEMAEATPHPSDKRAARLHILAQSEDGRRREVSAEGIIGVQLAHLMHACIVLSSDEEDEWIVSDNSHRFHLRRQGRQIEIARYPSFIGNSTAWLADDGLFLVDFGELLHSLSAAIEWLVDDAPTPEQDEMLPILIHQWERAWQRFSRLATFRRVRLAPA